ncbi:MAG TPA: DNA recombination protein RmuC [Terracidiphilus sp.]|nr:DNA recombination protein RmuC [Terracidiphilus sp.]
MGSPAILLAMTMVAIFLLGLWLGSRQGKSGMEQAVNGERKLAEAREAGIQAQLESVKAELAALKPKAEELTRVQEQLKNEQTKYAQMKADLDAVFKGVAADALRANTESFLILARQELGGQAQEAKNTLEAKEQAIKNLLDPLDKTLKSLDEQTRAMEKERSGAYGEIKTLVEGIGKEIPESLRSLRSETSQLITALRAPKTRGNWGELQLKRCVEYAGMVQYCSFAEQISARDGDNNLLRPDMTIQLPNGRSIIVDAKTPLDAFLDADNSADSSAQAVRFAAHAERVKTHLRELSSKAYWRQFEHTPEFVVCFLPSEALFSAALESDPSLIEFGSQANVVMATPTTLIALLKAVAYGWQQSKVAEDAKAIQETGRDLYNKMVNAHEYFEKMGAALGSVIGHYNKFVGAVEGRGGAFFHARKLGALVHDCNELDAVESVPAEPRLLAADDWPTSASFAFMAQVDGNGEVE